MVRVRLHGKEFALHQAVSDSEVPDPDPAPEADLMLPVGAEAELRSDDSGFHGSFYEVTISEHLASRGRYKVLYSTLVADDGGPLEETVAAANLRPRPPPSAGREFVLHEAVEALHNEGWWAGVVSAVPPPVAGGPRVYEVAFPTSRETMDFDGSDLRPHRVFKAGCWVPAAELVGSHLFREGTPVEVSRSARSFGESWSPASVLKVIGATSFLVQYTHIRKNGELATEIIDSQYIRPVRIDNRPSQSSYVEVMHEGSWWPGVVQEVLGSGIGKKYVVKLKSYETDMEDVEFVDRLTVASTQLRPVFDWDGKRWARRLPKDFFNGTKLPSRKRQSSALSSYNEVGERSDKNGSCGGKKLKSADVVSQPTSPLLSSCNDKYEILHKSSSCSNTVGMSGDLAKPNNGVDNVDLCYNVTNGRGMVSEIDMGNCVEPTTTPDDIGGSQQPGGGSALDERVTEYQAVQHLPFVKTSPLWAQLEGMEIFSRAPQRPHLNQLQQLNPLLREGVAFGLMFSFANLAEGINRLDDDNEGGPLEGKMQALSSLEEKGFEVGALRSRLETLLCRKNSRGAELRDDAMKALEEKIARKEAEDRELCVQIRVLAMAARDLRIYARLMREIMWSAVALKLNNAVEMARLKAEANELERSA